MNIDPIATFSSPLSEKFGLPHQSGLVPSLRGRIIFEPSLRSPAALKGLDGFDYLWLIWGFSANATPSEFRPTVRPPRLGGNETMGVFATRSPFRPNALGLSSVKILEISEDGSILVSGADLMDGTPIYDIKPYVSYCDSHPEARSGFVDTASWRHLEVDFPQDLQCRLSPEEVQTLTDILREDPRPRYQSDPTRIYGLTFAHHNIRFRVTASTLTLLSID